MSTAGKVLTVLVTLMTLVWILLASAATQLNRNGAKALVDLKKQVTDLEADVVKSDHDLQKLKADTHHQQLATQNDLTVLAARQADVEKARSAVLEIATRVRIQLADVEATVKSALAHSEQRLADKNAEIKAKADAEASVEKLKGENGKMIARLNALRDKFKTTLQENKSLVERLKKAGATTKPASISR
jgi:chromosome segregation ATPase